MSLGYVVRPRADKDIDDITEELVERATLDVALQFLAVAFETFSLMATQPDMGWSCRLQHPDLKSARVFRVGIPFEKYLIFYQPHQEQIEVLRIIHGAQDIEQRLTDEGVF